MVTDAAVGAARRSVEVTRGAPLHAHLDALHVHVLVERRAELVVLVLVLVGCRRRRATSTLPRPLFALLGSLPAPSVTHPLAARLRP